MQDGRNHFQNYLRWVSFLSYVLMQTLSSMLKNIRYKLAYLARNLREINISIANEKYDWIFFSVESFKRRFMWIEKWVL